MCLAPGVSTCARSPLYYRADDAAKSAALSLLAKATREARASAPHLMPVLGKIEGEVVVLDEARQEGLTREK